MISDGAGHGLLFLVPNAVIAVVVGHSLGELAGCVGSFAGDDCPADSVRTPRAETPSPTASAEVMMRARVPSVQPRRRYIAFLPCEPNSSGRKQPASDGGEASASSGCGKSESRLEAYLNNLSTPYFQESDVG